MGKAVMMRFARWSWLSPRPAPAGPRPAPAAKRRGLPRRPAPAPLDVDPRPLILSRKGIVVSWAPKSACSHVAIWFFLKEGLLPAANYYHPWPHNFRVEVYYRSLTYKRLAARLAASEGQGHTLLRIVRDPERRLVSIFRHVCRHPVLRKDIDRKLGIDTERDGLSLRQFDAFLTDETPVVPSRLNMHLCAQHHPTWAMPFDRVVTINMDEVELNPALNAFEADVGIEPTDFARLPKLADIATRHYAREAGYDGDGAIEDHRFRAADTDAFPKAALEASPLVREMARRHHGIDFTATRSGDSMDRLRFGAAAEPPLTAAPLTAAPAGTQPA